MLSGYIHPREEAPTLLEVKRSLLTFDRVVINDPEDRDFLPASLFNPINMGMFPMAMPSSTWVRPLRKVHGFDREFEFMISESRKAIQDNVIRTESFYDPHIENIVGFIADLNGFNFDINALNDAYCSMALDKEFIIKSIKRDTRLFSLKEKALNDLYLYPCIADLQLGEGAADVFTGIIQKEHLSKQYLSIGRGRIAALIRTISLCSDRGYVPVFSGPCAQDLYDEMTSRISNAIDFDHESWPISPYLLWSLNIIFSDIVDNDKIENIPIEHILKFRTIEWGKFIERRSEFVSEVALIAKQKPEMKEFNDFIAKEIVEMRKLYKRVADERKRINGNFVGELVESAGIGLATGIGLYGSMLSNLVLPGSLIVFALTALAKGIKLRPDEERIENELEMRAGKFGALALNLYDNSIRRSLG